MRKTPKVSFNARLLAVSSGLAVAAAVCACALPKAVLYEDPLAVEEHMKLGNSYEAQGLRSSAAKEYGAALRKDKAFVPALVALGNLAYGAGDLVEAEIYYRKALKIAPEHSSANNNLAVIYLTRGSRLDTAEELAMAALKRAGPLRPYVLDTLANIYIREGRYDQARGSLDQAEAMTVPDNVLLREHLRQSRRHLEALKGPVNAQGGIDR